MKNNMFVSFVFAVVAFLATSFSSNASELVLEPLSANEWAAFQTVHNSDDAVGAVWFGMNGTISATLNHMYEYEIGADNFITFGKGEVNPRFFMPQEDFFFTGLGTAVGIPGLPQEAPNAIVIDLRSLAGLNLTGDIGGNTFNEGVCLVHYQDWSPIPGFSMKLSSDMDFQGSLVGAGMHMGMYNLPVPEPTGGILTLSLTLSALMLRRSRR